ncbi:MAG: protein kinase [Bryobacteraceae bacterium]
MDAKPGAKLGPYEIVSSIGKGGMGEVWKARDTRLGRDVAIKISAQQFSDRFEVEAHAIASLNHPNVCTLFDVGPNYLVMEFIEGPTLAERIAEGPLALEEALTIARQIADALEAAHEKGIIHRDLKPANVKIRPDGSVKVLDFGLAKAAEATPFNSDSPTIMSVPGTILGTAGYMAPEQARAKAVDKRADIWAFGVVLYEMTARRRLFEGETVSDTLAAVIMKEPDLALAPATVQRLLRRCLEKDPKRRLRDIGDAMPLVGEVGQISDLPVSAKGPHNKVWMAATAILALIAAALAFVHFRAKPAEPVLRFTVPPEKGTFSQYSIPAVSPDGRHIAYVIFVEGKSELWVRDLDSLTSRLLYTENARLPFWSPDSRSIGFFAGRKVRKIDVSGGPALSLCDSAGAYGGTWGSKGTILFTPRNGPLFRVAATGGIPVAVTALDKASGEASHVLPWFLPDGRHFLYTATNSDVEKTAIYIGDLESPERRRLMFARSNAVYASHVGSAEGYLLFLREHTLMAQPFDAGKLQTTGDVFPIAEQVDTQAQAVHYGQFSASQNGVLAYTSGALGQSLQRLTWFDRSGKPLGTIGGPVDMSWPAISPDGKTVAFDRRDAQTGFYDIWLHDLARGTDSRFTFNSKNNAFPVWSPDGNYIAFYSNRDGPAVYRKGTGGTGQDEVVDKDGFVKRPTCWSPDGRFLLEETVFATPKTSDDIWVAPMAPGSSGGKPYPYLQTEFVEGSAKVSPNGQWLAYRSTETKRAEVYVMTFPNPGGKWQISTNGGNNPVWSRDGKELFFVSADNKMMAVDIRASGNKLEAGVPRALFDARIEPGNTGFGGGFDVSKEGKFLIPAPVERTDTVPMTVVVNWPAALKK